ncbi:MAG: DUF4186 domain-containing protein [Thermodesulfobacteriota bacterium]
MMDEQVTAALLSLKRSTFRSKFKLSAKDLSYLHDKGIETIRRHAFDFITARIAPAFPENDGKQTPMKNHPVFIAQHATATCCRSCLSKWHRIPKGRRLKNPEIDFIVQLIMIWIERQALSAAR